MNVHPGLCWTSSQPLKTGFPASWLIYDVDLLKPINLMTKISTLIEYLSFLAAAEVNWFEDPFIYFLRRQVLQTSSLILKSHTVSLRDLVIMLVLPFSLPLIQGKQMPDTYGRMCTKY